MHRLISNDFDTLRVWRALKLSNPLVPEARKGRSGSRIATSMSRCCRVSVDERYSQSDLRAVSSKSQSFQKSKLIRESSRLDLLLVVPSGNGIVIAQK
jgi:hypothetical protein